jgi:molybdopterin molybdotransferase
MRSRRLARAGAAGTTVASVLARLRRDARIVRRTEWVRPPDALGRRTADTVRARRFLPATDQAVMDGFAIRFHPPRNGVRSTPRRFRIVGRSTPGAQRTELRVLADGEAFEVLTGGTLPGGSSAVVRLEECRRSGDSLMVGARPEWGHDIARRGEDFRPGAVIATGGVRLRPWHVAALIANEVTRVRVVARPRVGLLSTGLEVIADGAAVRPGQVRDTTRPLLRGLLTEMGIACIDLGRAPDDAGTIARAIRAGLRRSDVVISVGGSSIGVRDRVPAGLQALAGSRWAARHVRLRPGGMTAVALVRRRPVFVLSGPPVAAFAGFVAVVAPFLRQHSGGTLPEWPSVTARLTRPVPHSPRYREFVRARLTLGRSGPRATPIARSGAARLSSLTGADGLVVLEAGRGEYRAGASVQVLRL